MVFGVIEWIELVQNRDSCRAIVCTVIYFWVPQKIRNFFNSRELVKFSRRIVMHGVNGDFSTAPVIKYLPL